jgi:hypothetical protein
MLLLAAVALLLLGAGALACALRLPLTSTLLAAYLFASAEVVLVAEALSPFHAIGRLGFLAAEALVAIAAGCVWLCAGRPLPPLPRLARGFVGRHTMLVVLAVAVGAALCFEASLAISAAPNNWDGMTYHLSRAAGWLQHGSLGRFDAHTERENIFPPNAEIQILFTFVFAHADRFAALPQLVAELALLVGIFGTARRLGFGRPDAAFAALVFATLTEIVLQATSVQNDLVVSAYLVACVYFLLGRTRVDVLLAGAALGLAVGTKLTALYALPVVAIVAEAVLPRRRLAELAVAGAVATGALGGYVFVSNTIHDGSPLGPASVRAPFTPDVSAGGTASSFSRILYRFVDLSGYRPDLRVSGAIGDLGESVFGAAHIATNPPEATQTLFSFQPNTEVNEDRSYFGPLGALLLLPLCAVGVAAFLLRRGTRAEAALALAIPCFALELALSYRYNIWLGRFMVVPVALAAALAARAYAARLISTTLVCIGIVFLALALQHNERKPVGREGAPVWSLSRTEAESLTAPAYRMPFEAVENLVPENATIGYRLSDEDLDYPLYGARLSRRLVQLPGRDTLGAAAQRNVDWVVTNGPAAANPGADGWTGVVFPSSHWRLLTRAGSADAERLMAYVRATPTPPEYRLVPPYLVGAGIRATAQSDNPNGSRSRSSALSSGTSRS